MPEAVKCIEVTQDIDSLWVFVSDLRNWAPCMPGYQSMELVNEKESLWRLKGDVGIFKRVVPFIVRIHEMAAPSRIHFTLSGKGEPVEGGGTYTAEALEPGRTRITLALSMEGRGMAKPVIDSLLGMTLQRDADRLVANILGALKVESPAG